MTNKTKLKRKNLFWDMRFIKYNLLKNPIKGGTPASENSSIVKKNTKKLSKLNILKEYRVLILVFIKEVSIQKNANNVRLYIVK
jgi:hypothetical protein